jgi:predicted metal-dependent phosphoesterase TrpH
VIKEIKKQNGIIIIPHPITFTKSMSMRYPLDKLHGIADALEIHNSRNIRYFNNAAKKACRKYNFAQTGSSDAHIPADIGNGYVLFAGNLRDAIRKKKLRAGGTTKISYISLGISVIQEFIITPIEKFFGKKNRQ